MANSLGLAGKVAICTALLGGGVAATTNDDFLIRPGSVGKLSVGMLASEILKFYPSWMIKGGFVYGEGVPYPVVEIRLLRSQKKPSLWVGLDETKDHRHTVARGINVIDRRFKTAAGIGPGSTIAHARMAIGDLTIESSEGETILNSRTLRMSFIVDDDESTGNRLYDKDGRFKTIPELPGDVRILSVWIY